MAVPNLLAWFLISTLALVKGDLEPTVLRLSLNERQEVEVTELVAGLTKAVGVTLEPPKVSLRLPMAGLGGPLSKTLLAETLGPDVVPIVEGRSLVLRVPAKRLAVDARPDWEKRLRGLVERIENEAKRRDRYGMHALASYRPNDPTRPTICLIHGLNSTSSVFWHMIDPIEAAGYGIVVYDFPYNRDLDESAEAFRRDWAEFRKTSGDKRPWAIVAHSMGALLSRAYVEDDRAYANDVASVILIAPVNRGSNLSNVQTLLQVVQGLKAVNNGPTKRGDALAHLGDGLGAAAEDLTPGSPFLKSLNAKRRRAGLPYHTLAGLGGFLSPVARTQIEAQLGLSGRPALLGGLARLAAANLPAQLDEITEGTGDGCVSLASTRLDGVDDHVTLPVNHLELIRAPLLYPDPGPVACMPFVLKWLAKDLPAPKIVPMDPPKD
jgi:pimeloyl-ACP methyl ester carboxylesterase